MTLKNTDSYKLSHKGFMNEGTTLIYSNLTPRSLRLMPRIPGIENPDVVMFGLQYFIKDFLINEWNRDFFSKPKSEVVGRFKRLTDAYLGLDSVPSEHFEQLHDLGYLPIKIKALREGTKLHAQIPVLTIYNTHKDFAWLTNYLETVLSSELWKPITVASIMYNWRKIVNDFAVKTTGSTDGTEFQLHDFSSRGMSGRHDSAICGAAFLLSSCGTDTVPAISLIEDYYNTDITEEFVATSVPATEHMISCLGTAVEGELESYRKWITKDYPTGIVSLVSDTYDYFKVLTEYLPQLKDDILARPANALGLSKLVVRPDSGNPVDIICGDDIYVTNIEDLNDDRDELNHLIDSLVFNDKIDIGVSSFLIRNNGVICKITVECFMYAVGGINIQDIEENYERTPEEKGSIEILWEIFGGSTTEQGYKLLDSHIGLIYGDSMTPERVHSIMTKLVNKGFATTNVVFGVGSYSLQYLTRDSLGMAVKATYAEVNGKGYALSKDPITDSGVKKSARGLLSVVRNGDNLELLQDVDWETEETGDLVDVFENGRLLIDEKYTDIRNRLWSAN